MANPLLWLAAWIARLLPMPVKRAVYQFPLLASLIRRSLNRAAPAGMAPVEIASGDLAGMHLKLDLQSEKDYWLGTYEPGLQQAIRYWVPSGGVAYDVGANIGYISLLLAKAVGKQGRVFAFEALPENLERLADNLAMNEIGARVTFIPSAVVDRPGLVSFLIGPSGGMGKVAGSAGRKEVEYLEAISVPGITLDQFVYQDGYPAPQVVKMDIEGGEVLALPGMRRLLEQARPLVFLELHGQEAIQMAWECFSSAGYRLYWMESGYPEISSIADLSWKAYLLAKPGESGW